VAVFLQFIFSCTSFFNTKHGLAKNAF